MNPGSVFIVASLLIALPGALACGHRAATLDGSPVDSAWPDVATLEAAPVVDLAPGDAAPGDAAPDNRFDLPPLDAGPADATWTAPLQIKVVKLTAWADLMPMVPNDPTFSWLTLELSNNGATELTGIKLSSCAFLPHPTGSAQATSYKPSTSSSFNGSLPGGLSTQVAFHKVQQFNKTPLPTACGSQLRVQFTVDSSAGAIGPLYAGPIAFKCVY